MWTTYNPSHCRIARVLIRGALRNWQLAVVKQAGCYHHDNCVFVGMSIFFGTVSHIMLYIRVCKVLDVWLALPNAPCNILWYHVCIQASKKSINNAGLAYRRKKRVMQVSSLHTGLFWASECTFRTSHCEHQMVQRCLKQSDLRFTMTISSITMTIIVVCAWKLLLLWLLVLYYYY